jgi:hypothetical protein
MNAAAGIFERCAGATCLGGRFPGAFAGLSYVRHRRTPGGEVPYTPPLYRGLAASHPGGGSTAGGRPSVKREAAVVSHLNSEERAQ